MIKPAVDDGISEDAKRKKRKEEKKILIEIHRVGIFVSIKSRVFPRIYQLIGPSRRSLSREHHPEGELCAS